MKRWANPSSPHSEGRAARAALEDARGRIKRALGWPHELIFTAGATEAAFIALNRLSSVRPLFTTTVEHAAVLRQSDGATRLAVGGDGIVDVAGVSAAVAGGTQPLVAVQHGNSETGIVQPLGPLGAAIHQAGGILFADCAQTAVKLPLPDADLIALSAHKFGGPPGIGALLVRDLALLAPFGGSQEQGYRAGTENLPAVLGFAAAAEAPWPDTQTAWRDELNAEIIALGGEVVGGAEGDDAPDRIATIASYRMPGMQAAAQLIRFDMMGIAVSAGSACSSGSIHTSHVLKAMGMDDRDAGEVIRVSFGRDTRREDLLRFADAWATIARDRGSRAA